MIIFILASSSHNNSHPIFMTLREIQGMLSVMWQEPGAKVLVVWRQLKNSDVHWNQIQVFQL